MNKTRMNFNTISKLVFFFSPHFHVVSKYTKHKLTIIRCQSQRLIWRRSESYNVLLSYNENKINKYKIYREKANYYNI